MKSMSEKNKKSFIFKGISLTKDIVFGKALLVKFEEDVVSNKTILESEISKEFKRFENVVEEILNEIKFLKQFSNNKAEKEILVSYSYIINDPMLKETIFSIVSSELICLELAIYKYIQKIKEVFSKMKNESYGQKKEDYEALLKKVLYKLYDDPIDYNIDEETILVKDIILPSELIKLSHKKLKALCLASGNKTSHSSIIARSLGINTIVNLGEQINHISNGDYLILDGENDLLYVNPEKEISENLQKRQKVQKDKKKILLTLLNKKAITSSGKEIRLMANLDLPEELPTALSYGAQGIGLLRTEFFYLGKSELPSEEEQFDTLKKLAQDIYPNKLIIRTMDIGGDKIPLFMNEMKELNPNLGLRGIRYSLYKKEIFINQLKAIIRASAFGKVKILLPMICSLSEIIQVKALIKKIKTDFENENVPFDKNLPVGIMVEVPSVALLADDFAKECDFFSIGTNDLLQYTIAVDRNNPKVAHYCEGFNPALKKLIEMTVKAAHDNGIKVAVCGELASEKNNIKTLVDFGVDELSVSPISLLEAKEAILNL